MGIYFNIYLPLLGFSLPEWISTITFLLYFARALTAYYRMTHQIVFSYLFLQLYYYNVSSHNAIFGTAQRCVCQFPFWWIYYYGSNKSTGKEIGKTHLSALVFQHLWSKFCRHQRNSRIELSKKSDRNSETTKG